MAFIFTCGTHTFQSLLAGYEQITLQCQRCGNFSAKINKRWEWFTFCFVPLIPFSFKPYHDVSCPICHYNQDVKYRPDAQQAMEHPNQAPIPMQGGPQHQGGAAPQGWNGQNQDQYQAPQGQPQYKQTSMV